MRAHPALLGLGLVLLALGVASLFAGGNLSPGVEEDRGNRWVLALFTLIGLADGYLPALTDRAGLWVLDGDTLRWIGVGLFGVGGGLRLWPVHVLGKRFSGLVAIQPGHALEIRGIYRFIRHPSYLGALLLVLGWGLAFRSGVGVLITVLFIPAFLARIRAEERLLRKHFGAAYESYCAHTWRLVPGVY